VSTGLSSCQVHLWLYFRHHRSLLSSTNLQVQFAAVLLNYSGCDCLLPLQVQFAAVLLNYSGCDCLLPIQVQLQLYFRTTQAQLCTTNSRATVYYLKFILF